MILELDEICGAAPEEDTRTDDCCQTAGSGQSDPKPEFVQYRDEGCRRAVSCLECPFPRCYYDVSRRKRKPYIKERNKEIKQLFQQGKNTKQLARRFKITTRTIERVIKGIKPGEDQTEK